MPGDAEDQRPPGTVATPFPELKVVVLDMKSTVALGVELATKPAAAKR
jgi:hypothetical protein